MILVIGQVEDDASLKLGGAQNLSNLIAVLEAKSDHPHAHICYKPHPDDILGASANRPIKSTLEEIARHCTIIDEKVSIHDLFQFVDEIYTQTSLAGLEALIHGKPVTTLGHPFYAGWGLTNDRIHISRKSRKLSLTEIIAGTYICYPDYFTTPGGQPSSPELTIKLIQEDLKQNAQP